MPGVTTRHPHSGRPHAAHSAIELRGLLEMAFLPWSVPLLMTAPRGDGRPVLLLPGFMGGESTLIGLKVFLRSRRYHVHTWGQGRNVGFQVKHAQALEQKVRHLHHATGRRVSVVGWSLGGVFARYGAHRAPECVRSVITLGSPVTVDAAGSASPPSCFYSLSDGVVPPQEATVDGDPALHENIRVPGSHIGQGFNALVLWIVAERLAQPLGKWLPFAPNGALGCVYRVMARAAAAA